MKKNLIIFLLGLLSHSSKAQEDGVRHLYKQKKFDKILEIAPTADMLTGEECQIISDLYKERGDRTKQIRWSKLAIDLNSDGYSQDYYTDRSSNAPREEYEQGGLIAFHSNKIAPQSAFYYYKWNAMVSDLQYGEQLALLKKALNGHWNHKILKALLLTTSQQNDKMTTLEYGHKNLTFLEQHATSEMPFEYGNTIRLMGEVCLNTRDTAQAEQLYLRGLEKMTQGNPIVLTQLLHIYLQRGDFKQAEATFQKAQKKYKDSSAFIHPMADGNINSIWYVSVYSYFRRTSIGKDYTIFRTTTLDTTGHFAYYMRLAIKKGDAVETKLLTLEKKDNQSYNIVVTDCATYYMCKGNKRILENVSLIDPTYKDFCNIVDKWYVKLLSE